MFFKALSNIISCNILFSWHHSVGSDGAFLWITWAICFDLCFRDANNFGWVGGSCFDYSLWFKVLEGEGFFCFLIVDEPNLIENWWVVAYVVCNVVGYAVAWIFSHADLDEDGCIIGSWYVFASYNEVDVADGCVYFCCVVSVSCWYVYKFLLFLSLLSGWACNLSVGIYKLYSYSIPGNRESFTPTLRSWK